MSQDVRRAAVRGRGDQTIRSDDLDGFDFSGLPLLLVPTISCGRYYFGRRVAHCCVVECCCCLHAAMLGCSDFAGSGSLFRDAGDSDAFVWSGKLSHCGPKVVDARIEVRYDTIPIP